MTDPVARHPDAYPPVALVTGAALRIGRAIALGLARDGWAVGVHYRRSAEAARALVETIAVAGGRAEAFQADLAREAEVAALVERVVGRLGPLGCLVNNASVFEPDDAASATRESWDRHLEPNLRAPLVLSQGFAAQLPEQMGGAVINLLDQRIFALTPEFLSYTLTKSGLWTLTRTLALGLAPAIRVNGIAPGPTLPSPRQSPAQFDEQCARLPLRRGPSSEEIVDAVSFILRSRSMTGQVLVLDGGQHLGWSHPLEQEREVE